MTEEFPDHFQIRRMLEGVLNGSYTGFELNNPNDRFGTRSYHFVAKDMLLDQEPGCVYYEISPEEAQIRLQNLDHEIIE